MTIKSPAVVEMQETSDYHNCSKPIQAGSAETQSH